MLEREMSEIYDSYAQTVYKFLLAQTHDADLSEDLTEETFLQAMKSMKRYDGSCKISVWLCQIAKHLWYRELDRRRRGGSAALISDHFTDTRSPETEHILQTERALLYKAIHTLDDTQREIVLLRLSGEFGFTEIGAIIGKTESFCRTTFYRAKEKLRGLLKDAQS
jgi:RNA polymerase sigma-70 factor (ECF subfamily)